MPLSITAIYPGTFDPITLGHQDMVRRAAMLFGRVIVAVAVGHHKKTMFNVQERIEMVQDAVKNMAQGGDKNHLDNAVYQAPQGFIEVLPFDGLLRDFVRAHGGQVMVRGVRAVSDFDYEFQLAGMNRQLMPEVETMCLMPRAHLQFISSTLVREIAVLGGEVDQFVTPMVMHRLEAKRVAIKD